MTTLNEFQKIATAGNANRNDVAMKKTEPLTMDGIDQQLGGQIGRPDLGLIGNWQADRHAHKLQLNAYKTTTSAKYELLGNLAVDALKAEAQLIREKLRVDWNHQYAALAEKAAIGEMTVARKLQGVLDAGRGLLYGDRKDVLERLEASYKSGELTDDDYAAELKYEISRYGQLLDEFVQIIDERRGAVRGAFRTTTTNSEGAM